MFSNALSYLPLHNHLNRAYHEAGAYASIPPAILQWRVPSRLVPKAIHKHIKPAWVVPDILRQIKDARKVVEELRSSLDREQTTCIHHLPDRPHRKLHRSIEVARQEVPAGFTPGWAYTFNPYELGLALLDEYEAFIVRTMEHPGWTPFTKLARINQEAKRIQASGDLVSSKLWAVSSD